MNASLIPHDVHGSAHRATIDWGGLMRFALILAGGSGTRLWPMSRSDRPKQILPIMNGKSLLELTHDRLKGVVDDERCFVCAGDSWREDVFRCLPSLPSANFLAEPCGRDTLNAIAYATAVIDRLDPKAVVGVFTADAIIEPILEFRRSLEEAYAIVERSDSILLTFGICPTYAATGFGWIQLGVAQPDGTKMVEAFREKPPQDLAQRWYTEGQGRYRWNSGMFVWKSSVLLDCIRRYEPETYSAARRIAADWDSPQFATTIGTIYPTLKKISVDYSVMQKAPKDRSLKTVCLPMELSWSDIGSWQAYAESCPLDSAGNALGAKRRLLIDTTGTLVASDDPRHLIAVMGCENLIVVHTATATLVCRREIAERVKDLQALVAEQIGPEYV